MIYEISANYLNQVKPGDQQTKDYRVFTLGERNTQVYSEFLKKCFELNEVAAQVLSAVHLNPELEFLDTESALYRFKPQIVYFGFNELEDRSMFYNLENGESWADKQFSRIKGFRSDLDEYGLKDSIFIVDAYMLLPDGISNYSNENSLAFQSRKLNWLLLEWSLKQKNVLLIDKNQPLVALEKENIINSSMKWSYSFPYSMDFESKLAWMTTQKLLNNFGKMKKCVVLDLDNTLWGGTIGDDGLEGIVLNNVEGRAYIEVQKWAKTLGDRGILLAVNSKNDHSIAEFAFREHPEMILSMEDIAIFLANWKNKDENILEIQRKLNISLDSIVFIDDNPYERELVRTSLPDVIVPDLPSNKNDIIDFLNSLELFEANLGNIDRNHFFQENLNRDEELKRNNLSDFLKQLQLKAVIKLDDKDNIHRISELSMRTNQFNLTGMRMSMDQVAELVQSENCNIISLELVDKHGNYGVIGYAHLNIYSDHLEIVNWCVSCRAFNRGVEQLMIDVFVKFSMSKNIHFISGEIIPTNRNKVVQNIYNTFGFRKVGEKWELDINTYYQREHYITSDLFAQIASL